MIRPRQIYATTQRARRHVFGATLIILWIPTATIVNSEVANERVARDAYAAPTAPPAYGDVSPRPLGPGSLEDCNFNGVDDVLDIELGNSIDCDGNQRPDECQIAECPGNPECDDCNINGFMDVCDIEFQQSEDTDGNAIPDECVAFRAGIGVWSNPENWSGGKVPNNQDGGRFSVTLEDPSTKVLLDINVQVDSLRILNGSILNISNAGPVDIAIIGQGGVLNRGQILVGNNSQMNAVGGRFVMGCGGMYMADPDAPRPVVATLITDFIEIRPTCCGAELIDQLTINDRMRVVARSGFLMNGTLPQLEMFACPELAAAGGLTPPAHRSFPASVLDIGGDMELQEAATVEVDETDAPDESTVAGGNAMESSVKVAGNFINNSRFAPGYKWSKGTVNLQFNTNYEVAGIDVGPAKAGFQIDNHTNYSVNRMTLEPGGLTTFLNELPNLVGVGDCKEALYVHELVIQEDAIVLLENVRVYYEHLIVEDGVAIDPIGCGNLIPICQLDPFGPLSNGHNTFWHNSNYYAFQNCFTGKGPFDLDPCCATFDLDFDNDVDWKDYQYFLDQIRAKGDCCAPHARPRCHDPVVTECVCEIEPRCCTDSWDAVCVELMAELGCGTCCDNGLCESGETCATCPADCDDCIGSCCIDKQTPGCMDLEVQKCVCADDPYCCEVRWDDSCAAAADRCGSCNGECCEINPTPGCDDEEIEECVCAQDPFCCETEWDILCPIRIELFECGVCCGDGSCNAGEDCMECPEDCGPCP